MKTSVSRFVVAAVLFDLDGTLVDSLDDLATAAAHMLKDCARPPRQIEEIRSFVGKGISVLVQRCLDEGQECKASKNELERSIAIFKHHYALTNGERSQVYPNVVSSLNALTAQGIKLACVTNKASAFTLPLLEKTALRPFFEVVVSGDTLSSQKPDPAMLLYACEQLGISPQHALMVGDSANDALAARAANIPVLLLTYGYSEGKAVEDIDCDGLIDSTQQVLEQIKRH